MSTPKRIILNPIVLFLTGKAVWTNCARQSGQKERRRCGQEIRSSDRAKPNSETEKGERGREHLEVEAQLEHIVVAQELEIQVEDFELGKV